MANTARILYSLAEQADRRYAETIKSRTGKTRWTLTTAESAIPEIKAAYQDKRIADERWLSFLRNARNSA